MRDAPDRIRSGAPLLAKQVGILSSHLHHMIYHTLSDFGKSIASAFWGFFHFFQKKLDTKKRIVYHNM